MLDAKTRSVYFVLGFASLITTVVVITANLNEPVNAPKMFTLVIGAFSLLALLILPVRESLRAESNPKALRIVLFTLVAIVILNLISNLNSSQRFDHGFFGNYGRNTGSLTYFSLSVFFLAALIVSMNNFEDRFGKFFFFAGFANLVYFAMTLFGIEIFDWNNPNNLVLGTFGNTNFVGAFMGMFFVFLVSQIFRHWKSRLNITVLLSLLALTGYEIFESKATQGVIVAALGVAVILFLFIRSEFGKALNRIYFLSILALSSLTIAGILQVGPLADYLYKTSVSLRGAYWEAGWRMGLENPLFGIGPDSYGFYYRQFRDPSVLKLTGPETVTDVAHNVFLDFFASGGIPLLLAYITLQVLVLIALVNGIRRTRKFDPVFAGLVAMWFGYQAQSIVSINQIGVAIWGWIFGGLIVGREIRFIKMDAKPISNEKARTVKNSTSRENALSPIIVLSTAVMTSIGLIIGIQPLVSDAAYNAALKKRDLVAIDAAARKWPTNQIRIAEASKLFSDNGFMDQSLDLVRFGIKKYPDSFVLWYVYFRNSQTEASERAKAKLVLRKIDPLNPEFS